MRGPTCRIWWKEDTLIICWHVAVQTIYYRCVWLYSLSLSILLFIAFETWSFSFQLEFELASGKFGGKAWSLVFPSFLPWFRLASPPFACPLFSYSLSLSLSHLLALGLLACSLLKIKQTKHMQFKKEHKSLKNEEGFWILKAELVETREERREKEEERRERERRVREREGWEGERRPIEGDRPKREENERGREDYRSFLWWILTCYYTIGCKS